MRNFIGYYRVSTEKQGQSGLGLSAQQSAVKAFIESQGGNLVGEFSDVISGSKVDRPGLDAVKQLAKETDAIVVVKAIDRLSREGFEVSMSMDKLGITVIDCDSPGDGELIRDIKLSMAKEERNKIRVRTQAAMDKIKENIERDGYHISKKSGRKITSLGNTDNFKGGKNIRRSVAARKRKAKEDPNNQKAIAVIKVLRKQHKTYRAIAAYLNEHGFKTSRGNDFSAAQVRNLRKTYSKHVS